MTRYSTEYTPEYGVHKIGIAQYVLLIRSTGHEMDDDHKIDATEYTNKHKIK